MRENIAASDSMRGGWRVKLYELEQSGTWVDHGIGFAFIQLTSNFNGPALCVFSETNNDQFLLQSKIQSEDLYEKQGGKVLWTYVLPYSFALISKKQSYYGRKQIFQEILIMLYLFRKPKDVLLFGMQ